MTRNPYQDRASRTFWRQGVVNASPLDMADIYTPKWSIDPAWSIATAGSCFAQHIARNLRQNGYNVIDTEPAPNGLRDPQVAARFGYGLYSARFGNIYTARQLLQLVAEAAGQHRPSAAIWQNADRYYDAVRPNVEPEGLPTPEDVTAQRAWHLERVRDMIQRADLLVFTLGLTEAWEHIESGTVYPTAPGVIAGDFDPAIYRFVNFSFEHSYTDLTDAIALIRDMRGAPVRVLLTVSPVPLTATAEERHVLLSSTYSKSVLRAVAGQVAAEDPLVDYFPSYEIVTNPAARGVFFGANLRNVTPQGVDVVMRHFFATHPPASAVSAPPASPEEAGEAVCEEAMLEAFGK